MGRYQHNSHFANDGDAMNELTLTHIPQTKTGMLIRKPPTEVFEALVNPDLTTQFWFTKSSGRLEAGRQVQWEWEMYNASASVIVNVVEPNKRIVITWPGYLGPTSVEWILTPYEDETTFVRVTEVGFIGNGDELVTQVTDSTQGFSLMLAGLKAFLEYNVRLNLVGDRYPSGIEEH
jgi:uncharacterized protein YndB with AHSA1/START domain